MKQPDGYLDRLPISDQTPKQLQEGVYESSAQDSTEQHQAQRDQIKQADTPQNQLGEKKAQLTSSTSSLGSQMTNNAASIGEQVRNVNETTGKDVKDRSDDSLVEGSLTAIARNPGDAIDEVQKWFGGDKKDEKK